MRFTCSKQWSELISKGVSSLDSGSAQMLLASIDGRLKKPEGDTSFCLSTIEQMMLAFDGRAGEACCHNKILAFSMPESLEKTSRQGLAAVEHYHSPDSSIVVVDSVLLDLGVDRRRRGHSAVGS